MNVGRIMSTDPVQLMKNRYNTIGLAFKHLSPMESIQQLNRPGGLWWDSDLLPLGGNLSLVLLIEIVPRQSNLKTIAVCLQPSLVLKK